MRTLLLMTNQLVWMAGNSHFLEGWHFISTFQGLATLPRFFSIAFGHLALHRKEQERLQIPSWVLTVATHQKICKEQATT